MSSNTNHQTGSTPERVSTTDNLITTPVACTSNAKLKRSRSITSGCHYSNGQEAKKGPGGATYGKEVYRQENGAEFIQKTYDMINTCQSDIAGWTRDSTAFVIKDKSEFAEQIIPKFFNHKLDTFVRQLQFYGFSRRTSNDKRIYFSHSHFQRNKKHLLKEIKRSKIKRSTIKRSTKTQMWGDEQSQQEMQIVINELKGKVSNLETQLSNLLETQRSNLETQIANIHSIISHIQK